MGWGPQWIPFSQLELLERRRAQVLEQCARCIQGSWRRHRHRKQERQRRAAVLIQAGRTGALGTEPRSGGPHVIPVSFEMLLLESPCTRADSVPASRPWWLILRRAGIPIPIHFTRSVFPVQWGQVTPPPAL